MKKVYWVAGLIAVFSYSCKTDFEITTGWSDITIIYGLLDKSDTAQYVRVEKAFLDPVTSALDIAQIPDSLYYNELSVELQEIQNGNNIHTIPLEKVDGNLEGYPKDTGIFAQSPNILYKTTEALNSFSSYRLVVTKPDDSVQISASTEIIDDFTIQRPSPLIKVNLLPGNKYQVSWLTAQDGKIYQLVIRIHYVEYQFSDPLQKEDKFVDWTIFTDKPSPSTAGGLSMDEDLIGDNFYAFLNSAIPDNPSVFRVIRKADFMFSVGGETLDTYNQVYLAQQGLTSGQVLPNYTNVDNGLGIFSTRFHKTVSDVSFENRTIDSISCFGVTQHLNFLRSDSSFCP